MKTWIALSPPCVLFLAVLGALFLIPGAADWNSSAAFRMLPHILFAVSITLGLIFRQSRVSFISILSISVTLAMQRAAVAESGADRIAAATLIAAI